MKRNMDLIRLLLLQQEGENVETEIKRYDEKLILYNLVLMDDAGLIEAAVSKDGSGRADLVTILRLTWAGHDFLDAARDPSIWSQAKEKILKPGVSWTFSVLVEFLKSEATRSLRAVFGLPPSS